AEGGTLGVEPGVPRAEVIGGIEGDRLPLAAAPPQGAGELVGDEGERRIGEQPAHQPVAVELAGPPGRGGEDVLLGIGARIPSLVVAVDAEVLLAFEVRGVDLERLAVALAPDDPALRPLGMALEVGPPLDPNAAQRRLILASAVDGEGIVLRVRGGI